MNSTSKNNGDYCHQELAFYPYMSDIGWVKITNGNNPCFLLYKKKYIYSTAHISELEKIILQYHHKL